MNEDANAYSTTRIQVLEGREAIRKRPGMYIGSTGERGLNQLVFEVADRAVNEVLTGRASRVDITLTPDGGVEVADDGPDVPFADTATARDVGGPGLGALLTTYVGMGPTHRHAPMLGLLGMGLFVANALSSSLTAETRHEGLRRVQEFARGVAVTSPTDAGPATGSGTAISFRPDTDIFETAEFSFDALAGRFRELAFLYRDLDISLTDRRSPAEPRSARFRSPGGARDFVAFIEEQEDVAPLHPDVIGFEQEDARMAGTVEVACRWSASHQARVRSFANDRPTPGGGTHEMGFHDGVAAAVNAYARGRQLLPATAPDLSTARIGEGLTAVVSVKLDRPEFEGSTRGMLGCATVRACVGQAVQEHLGRWLDGHPEQAATVVDRIVQGARQD